MKNKKFGNPVCEIVRFDTSFITTSGCGCYDEALPNMTDCTNDGPAGSTCEVNYVAGTANCIPCANYNG